jgi:hypothetical protein
VFARQDSSETVIIAINRQEKEQEVTVPFKTLAPLLGKNRVIRGPNITLLPNSAVAFRAS